MSVTAARRLSMTLGLSLAVSSAAATISGGTTGPVGGSASQGAASVVVVVGDEGGNPVSNARVIIWPSEYLDEEFARNGQTDGSGQVAVANVRPGRYTVYVDVRGYPIAASDEFDLDSGDLVDLGTLRLAPGIVVTGRVVDADGEPVSGVRVEAGRLGDSWPHAWEQASMVSGTDGGFRLTGVPSTGSWLKVEAEDYGGYSQWLQFPGGHTGEFALRPSNIGGRMGQIRLEFVDEAGRRLASPVPPDWPGRPEWYRGDGWVPTVRSVERRTSSEFHDNVVYSVVPNGVAEWKERPGLWRVFIDLPGHRPLGSRLKRTGQSGWSELSWWDELTVESGQPTVVRYVVTQLPRVSVELAITKRQTDGTLTPASGAHVSIGRGNVSTGADDDGIAIFASVPVGRHEVSVSGLEGYDYHHMELRVSESETLRAVTLEPSRRAQIRTISGVVLAPRSAIPLAGVKLEFQTVPGMTLWGSAATTTDTEGRFEVVGDLPEGPYRVTAEQGDSELGGQGIWVAADPHQNFTIRPAPLVEPTSVRADVHGTVAGMRASRTYEIYAHSNGAPSEDVFVPVGVDGSFVLHALRAGHWRLELRVGHGPTCGSEIEQSVRLRAGEPARVHFTLPPLHDFKGQLTGDLRDVQSVEVVRREDGRCLAQATVDADGFFGPILVPDGTHEFRALRGKSWRWPVHAEVRSFPSPETTHATIAPASLHVRVIDAESGEPLPHAGVGLTPVVGESFNGFAGPAIRVDRTGEFFADPLAHGRWTLAVDHERLSVDLAPGEAKQLMVAVSPGVPLRVRYQGGSRPTTSLRLVDSKGHSYHGYFDEERSVEKVLAEGVYDLVASNDYGYEHTARVTLPGPEIVLPDPPRRGQLRVLVPELYRFEGDLRATLTLEGSDQVIVGERGDGSREAREWLDAPARGAVTFEHVPAGKYLIQVTSEDGREFFGIGTVASFTENDATVRSRGL